MKRPVRSARLRSIPAGYTLIEILVATLLSLMLMVAVVRIFASIGDSVADSRATVEMCDRLRSTGAQLQMDLDGATVTMRPPRHPETNEGYFEYTEGPLGPVSDPWVLARNTDTGDPTTTVDDTTVGDIDDILMFTTRSSGRSFTGRATVRYMVRRLPTSSETATGTDKVGDYVDDPTISHTSVESQVAEVAWFVRGTTLYRRVLLVQPAFLDADLRTTEPEFPTAFLNHVDSNGNPLPPQAGFFGKCDISVRLEGNRLVANTLGDLTKRENRFAHQTPATVSLAAWATLGLPTLRECSYVDPAIPAQSWVAGTLPPIQPLTAQGVFDAWINPHPWVELDRETGTYKDPNATAPELPDLPPYMGQRVAEDVILTNVIGFDVKAWDPGAPVVLDMNGTPNKTSDDVAYAPGDREYLAKLTAALGSGSDPVIASYGAYVDLGYNPAYTAPAGMPTPLFHVNNHDYSPGPRSSLVRVYDTWSSHYEHDGMDQHGDGEIDLGTNGFDDNADGIVDDPAEFETSPPYPVPLRGIRVKIRVFEPDSRQIREVTVVQDFLPK